VADAALKIILTEEGGTPQQPQLPAAASSATPPIQAGHLPQPSMPQGVPATPVSAGVPASRAGGPAASSSDAVQIASGFADKLLHSLGLGPLADAFKAVSGAVSQFAGLLSRGGSSSRSPSTPGATAAGRIAGPPVIPPATPATIAAAGPDGIPWATVVPRANAGSTGIPAGLATAGPAARAVPAVAGATMSPAAAGPATSGASSSGLAGIVTAAGPVAIGLAAVAAVATAAVVAVKMFASTVKDQAQKLEGYSGAVAGATAMSEIRQELAMFRRGARIGPDIARWESIRGRFEERLADVGTELLNVVLKFANQFEGEAETAIELLGLAIKAIDGSGDFLKTLPGILSPTLGAYEVLKKMFGFMQDEARREPADDPMWEQFDQILSTRLAWKPPRDNAPRRLPADPRAPDPRLNATRARLAAGDA